MRRVIVDYKKLTPQVLTLLTEKFPDGYNDDDIIVFNNHRNETVEAVEIKTEDTIYLVKVSSKLTYTMSNFDNSVEQDVNELGHVIVNNDIKDELNSDEEE